MTISRGADNKALTLGRSTVFGPAGTASCAFFHRSLIGQKPGRQIQGLLARLLIF